MTVQVDDSGFAHPESGVAAGFARNSTPRRPHARSTLVWVIPLRDIVVRY